MSSADDRPFGMTNDRVWLQRAAAWRDAAIGDGWIATPTYQKHEGVDRACTLEREGFKAQILTRDDSDKLPPPKYLFQAKVSVWGPDRLSIVPPDIYDWAEIRGALTACNECGKGNLAPDQLHQFGFAGRCCSDCLPAMRAKHEGPGWTL